MADGSGMHERITAPIDKGADKAAIAEMCKRRAHPGRIERTELSVGHLAARHGEFPMIALGDMAADWHIVGLVGQDQTRRLIAEKYAVHLRV